jgi:NAD(P)-dependent dehydrogenase (short-subunit alcohol dehydrogenase family)
MGLLDGKVAIITGAGGGLGRAYALLFASEGAKIVVNDYGGARDGTAGGEQSAAARVVEEIIAAGGEAVANIDDVGSVNGGQNILSDALQAFGRVDILINNAGILRDKSLLKMEEEDFDAVLRVHLKGTFCVTKPVFQQMKEQGQGGVIVNTSSTSGLFGQFGQTNYAAAKGGVFGFSNSLAQEGHRFGIRVWTLAPAAATRLSEDVLPEDIKAKWKPERVAPAILYMVSDLSGDRTGKIMFVSGTKIMELRLQGAPGFKPGDNFTAQDIAAATDSIFLTDEPVDLMS